MDSITLDPTLLPNLSQKTTIITGATGAIGSSITRLFATHNANVVIADLPFTRLAAETLITSLPDPTKGIFVPVDILNWEQVKSMYKVAIEKFGSVDVVVANAGVMEFEKVLNVDRVDRMGDPVEPREAYNVIDINVKGTLNTLLSALHYMKDNKPSFQDGSRGSIVLISSTSGYFGGTGVTGYITSKHAITGLLRSSQLEAKKLNIRVNAIAPFLTPSNMSAGFSQQYISRGLEANTPEGVARVVATIAMDDTRRGCCYLTCGKIIVEMEQSLKANTVAWLGNEAAELMVKAAEFFDDIGGYVLPKRAVIDNK